MKRFLLTLVLIVQGFVAFTQSANLDGYIELYDRLPTWQDKLVILREMTAANLENAAEFYAKALRELTWAYHNSKAGSTEWVAANDIARILIAQLVSARYEAAGNDLWRCYQVFTDSTVRAEALIALGELKIDSRYADVEGVVIGLNAKTNTTNRQNDENIAAGGFAALERYGKPEGYLAAFVGSESWYRDSVKQVAMSAFTALLQDPARLLPDVIMSNQYSLSMKQKALAYVDTTTIDNIQKADIACKSLVESWRVHFVDQRLVSELSSLRRFTLQLIGKYGVNGEKDTYTALNRSLRESSFDEKLGCILALGAVKTPEAVTILLDYAQTLNNNRYLANSHLSDDRLMRSLILVMGESSDPRSKDMLRQVLSAPWGRSILEMAQAALSKSG